MIVDPPVQGGDHIDWDRVAEGSGLRFPADYRDFVAVYGGGTIDDFLTISTPPVPGSVYGNLLTRGRGHVNERVVRELAGVVDDPAAYPLLAFAATSGGDEVLWLCDNPDPDKWRILVRGRHTVNRWSVFNLNLLNFLLAMICGELANPFSQSGFPASPCRFTGWREEDAYFESLGPPT